jgi:exopolysaccharide biosynthesis polyprenyl glycosylphosphotransferase
MLYDLKREGIPPRRRALTRFSKLLDLVALAVAWAAGTVAARGDVEAETWPSVFGVLKARTTVEFDLLALAYLFYLHLVLTACGLYRSHRLSSAGRELREIALAVLLGAFPLVVAARVSDSAQLTPHFLVAFPAIAFALLAALRLSLRGLAHAMRAHGRNLRDVVAIAADDRALASIDRLTQRTELGYRVVRVIDVRQYETGLGKSVSVQAVAEELERVLEERPVDEVFLALNLGTAQSLVRALLLRCEQQGIVVRVLAELSALDWARTTVDALGEQPVITVSSGPRDALHLAIKRAIDLVGATIGLVVLAPVFAALAIAIKLDSKGPVIFAQERVGLNRRRFRALKFRTMVRNAEALQKGLEDRNEADGPVFKIEQDPRVTRVGRILRKLSLDELPQLWNVIRGDMSLVGPRPLPVRDVSRMDVRWHRRRFSVKPGITCVWQATRREPKFDEWIRSDMEYIDNWSLGLDLKILAKTFSIVVSRGGVH